MLGPYLVISSSWGDNHMNVGAPWRLRNLLLDMLSAMAQVSASEPVSSVSTPVMSREAQDSERMV